MSDATTSAAAESYFLYKELWRQAKGSRTTLLTAMALLVGAQCILLAVPFLAVKAINALQARGDAGLANAGSWLALVRGVVALLGRRLESAFEPLKCSIVLNEAKWFTVDVASRALSCGLVAQGPEQLLAAGSPDFRQLLAASMRQEAGASGR